MSFFSPHWVISVSICFSLGSPVLMQQGCPLPWDAGKVGGDVEPLSVIAGVSKARVSEEEKDCCFPPSLYSWQNEKPWGDFRV